MITYYEAKDDLPSEPVFQALISTLDFPSGFFFQSDLESIPADRVSFRARRSLTSILRDKVLAAGEIASEIVSPAFRSRFRFPELDVPDLTGYDPELAAQTVRDAWGLGQSPIDNMVHLLEAKGIDVFWLNESSTCVDAVSFWKDGRPFVTLNLGKSGERGRMDAAHELGHLVLHRHSAIEKRDDEDDATRFASAFLLPRHQFAQECPRLVSFNSLFRIKPRWKVSVAAMLVRGHELGIYSDWVYGKAFRDLSCRGWRTNEPEPVDRECSSIQAQAYDRLGSKGVTPEQWSKVLHLSWRDVLELTPEAQRLEDRANQAPFGMRRSFLRVVEGGLAASDVVPPQ